MANKDLKILTLDIETAPNFGAFFELYKEGNILWKTQEWYILCVAAKWLGEDKVMCASLPDYKEAYKRDKTDDSALMSQVWSWIDEADVIITQNGDEFDMKKINARFLFHGMTPPSPYGSVDTKKVLKKYFKFDSNSLKQMTQLLGISEKFSTEGKNLWKRICVDNDKEAWKEMIKYNKQDVVATEALYIKLRPWMKNHPNLNLLLGTRMNCPNCGENRLIKHKLRPTRSGLKQQYLCHKCGSYHTAEAIKLDGIVAR